MNIDQSNYSDANRHESTLPLTTEAWLAVFQLDNTYIGTKNYMGLALYGSAPYKHLFREAEPALRARLHDAILGAGLDLDGCGEAHEWVIEPFIPPYLSETWAMCKRQRLKYV